MFVVALSAGGLSEVILSCQLIAVPLLPLPLTDSTQTWAKWRKIVSKGLPLAVPLIVLTAMRVVWAFHAWETSVPADSASLHHQHYGWLCGFCGERQRGALESTGHMPMASSVSSVRIFSCKLLLCKCRWLKNYNKAIFKSHFWKVHPPITNKLVSSIVKEPRMNLTH